MDYYISKNDGKYYGPFKKDSLIANGLDLDTLVWREGLPAWTQAKMLPELSDICLDVPLLNQTKNFKHVTLNTKISLSIQ